jgi:formylmethanofuran--tetrahydromethanopterin N-formyltransferase
VQCSIEKCRQLLFNITFITARFPGFAVLIGSTQIVDTFAEAFSMWYARLIVTAVDRYWCQVAIDKFCGYGTSVIGCDAEVGRERDLEPEETDDGRPGAAILIFGFSQKEVGHAVEQRAGQCLLTCPTTAVFDGCQGADDRVPLGSKLRFFGDGFQKSKLIGHRRFWRIPVMDGEFLVEQHAGVLKGIAGGNFLIQSVDQAIGLRAARQAVEAIGQLSGVVTPFPGGVARSGSKVGSKYKGLIASTADAYCPDLRARTNSLLHFQANCVYEIVIDGISFDAVTAAMAVGIRAACVPGVVEVTAGNYGGKLGKHHFHLHQVLGQ